MKAILTLFLLAMLAGCAASIPTATVNDKAAIAYRTATLASQASTAEFRAGKITAAQDVKAQAALVALVAAVDAAKKAGDAAAIDAANAKAEAIKTNPGSN